MSPQRIRPSPVTTTVQVFPFSSCLQGFPLSLHYLPILRLFICFHVFLENVSFFSTYKELLVRQPGNPGCLQLFTGSERLFELLPRTQGRILFLLNGACQLTKCKVATLYCGCAGVGIKNHKDQETNKTYIGKVNGRVRNACLNTSGR